ncbi:hypothetical protein AD937_03190 [Gluconobacter japonicus]|nr:hypothetical protein AD937_03190 [Gluconobacter japonicus]KXV31961.1 hypothetical protein AD938_00035 [Gluconobacter japonicus]
MPVVMEALDGCFLDCPVYPLNLIVRPGMIGFRRTMFEEFSGCLPIGFPHQLCDSEFACPVDSNEEMQLTLSSLDFGNIDVKKSRWDSV